MEATSTARFALLRKKRERNQQMSKKNLAVLILSWFVAPVMLLAQKNELSFSVGGIITADQNTTDTLFLFAPCPVTQPNCDKVLTQFQTDTGVALGANYARRLVGFGPTSLYVELPIVGVPGRDVHAVVSGDLVGSTTFTLSSWSLFFTPSAKVKFLGSTPISPFVSVGGGLAHSAQGGTSTNKGAFQFGGGLDFKTPIPRLGFRAEVRDFYAASFADPSNFTKVSPERLHHVFAAGGVVVRF
jgi:hypothetical protein